MAVHKFEKINDLSDSALRKKFSESEFAPETNYAVAMGRVSTKKQKGDAHHSDRAQLETIEKYIEKENLELVHTPWDVAETASKHERRRHFQELIDYVRSSQPTKLSVKHVVFSHQSRSNRNRESARELETLLKLGVTLHFARDGRKLTSQSDLDELLMWHMNNVMNEKYVRDHTRNVMDGTFKRIEIGLFPGKGPYGYRNFRADEKSLSVFIVMEQEAAYVRRAFELFSTGRYSVPALKVQLDQDFSGLVRKPDVKRLGEILLNAFYHGEFTYAGQRYVGHPEYHPRLISVSLWQRVQDVLKQPHRSKRKVTEHNHAYLGLMKCGGRILDESGNETDEVCGCAITGEEKRKPLKDGTVKRHYYWHCSSSRPCSQSSTAHMAPLGLKPNYTQGQIEALFEGIFRPLRFTPDVVTWMQGVLLTEHRQKCTDHKAQVAALKRGHEMLQIRISKAYEDKLTGVIPESMWREKHEAWSLEAEAMLEQISVLDGMKEALHQNEGHERFC